MQGWLLARIRRCMARSGSDPCANHILRNEDVAGAPDIDDLLGEWRDDRLASIQQHVFDMHFRRKIHDEFMDMLDAQNHQDRNYFGDVFHGMYVEAQILAIRRLTDSDNRTLSLHRLIGQLEQHRREFTRKWYVDRWMGDRNPESIDLHERTDARFHQERANADFDRFVDSPGAAVLGGRGLQEDLQALADATDRVVAYANSLVAHTQRERSGPNATYGELNKALDLLGEMLQKYYLLIDQGGLVSVIPTPQGDWKGPFRTALVSSFQRVEQTSADLDSTRMDLIERRTTHRRYSYQPDCAHLAT